MESASKEALTELLKKVQFLQGEEGKKGDRGDQGIPGKNGRDGVDGKSGVDGIDGKAGRNGIDGRDGREGIDGSPDSPQEIANKLNTLESAINVSVIDGIKELVTKTDLEKYQGEVLDGMTKVDGRIKAIDMRWRGGGLTQVFHDNTLTGLGTQSSPLHAIATTTTPAGATTQVQFNNSGAFGADSTFTFLTSSKALSFPLLRGVIQAETPLATIHPPTISFGNAAGGGAVLNSLSGNNVNGRIIFTTGAGCSANDKILTFTFIEDATGNPYEYDNPPCVFITPENAQTAQDFFGNTNTKANIWINPHTDTFDLNLMGTTPLSDVTQYQFSYFIIGNV